MKRLLVVSLAVVMAFAMLAACTVVPAAPVGEPAAAPAGEAAAAEEAAPAEALPPLKIGYSMPSATHGYMARAIYWAETGMADWKAKDPSLEFLFVTADNVTKQANDIEDLIQQDIDALIVFPFDASVTSVVEKAYEAGIYTVVMDCGTSKPVYDIYLSNDDEGYTHGHGMAVGAVGLRRRCRHHRRHPHADQHDLRRFHPRCSRQIPRNQHPDSQLGD